LNYNGYCSAEVDPLIAVNRSRPTRKSAAGGLGDRTEIGGGWRSTHHLLRSPRDLLAAARERATLMVNSLFNGWRMEDGWLDN
jgi:hypothetical protein